ncbi:MAG: SLBB domain-containing protein [Candidatus Cloacimonetes bacterium]|nr:SLBB domain-containing protein [Candidatus Cloacimonadota bacterium]MCF7814965.1 SLBB domain-containing protein [Candidatus Cloacimonadota bacterium]MCF7868426.1 SLBB domain-containing protein [Candidatus Cloacimonadota bacterium]MCF7883899.1 SLBB domain-containing protein [Candidatus Cloacimonadota bacterium]
MVIKKLNIIFIILGILFSLNAQYDEFDSAAMMYHVSLVGAVPNPGVFLVPPSTRVSQVIKLAEAEYLQTRMPNADRREDLDKDADLFKLRYEEYLSEDEDVALPEASQRLITIKRKEGDVKIDLAKFYTFGKSDENPYIMDGDIIFIPALQNRVEISGAVNKEGQYEIVDGDRIVDAVEFAFGTANGAFLEEVEILRFHENNRAEKLLINLKNALEDENSEDNILLQNGDHIFVRFIPDFHEKKFVKIAGEVEFPGEYLIVEGETTLLEVLEKCGIDEENADLENAFVQRPDVNIDIDPEFERLKTTPQQTMHYLEYAYFKNKTRQLKAKMSVDIQKLWNSRDEAENIVLEENDFIFIPLKSKTVYVTGQVANPGFVKIEPGLTYIDYIEKAGGMLRSARKGKTRIIKANSTLWMKPNKDLIIEEGDMIFVPEKSELDYWQLTKDTLTLISQVATLYVIILRY